MKEKNILPLLYKEYLYVAHFYIKYSLSYSMFSRIIISYVNCNIFCIISNLVFDAIFCNLNPTKLKKESISLGSGDGGRTILSSLHIASANLSIALVESLFSSFSSLFFIGI